MFGAVEDSTGGCTNGNCYYDREFWLYIMDRQGRIVWYYADAASNAASSFQRIARDGEYIWIEKARTGSDRGRHQDDARSPVHGGHHRHPGWPTPSTSPATAPCSTTWAASCTRWARGATTSRMIWSCPTAFGSSFQCYTNTVNWDPVSDTVMMSFPEPNTVAQINRQTGALVATYGDRAGSYTFSPSTWSFEFQHFPNITAQGTLIVSTHLSMYPHRSPAGPMHHAFVEFEIDRTNRRLVEKWSYTAGHGMDVGQGDGDPPAQRQHAGATTAPAAPSARSRPTSRLCSTSSSTSRRGTTTSTRWSATTCSSTTCMP